MHIEPGILAATKVIGANAAALATLGAHAAGLVRRPAEIAATLLAAAFFSVFMQLFHTPVGPSELHFVGASAVYLTFGFRPTLFGFALGLALQGLLFEPADLVHLGVNALSLMLPLIATHALLGRRFFAERGRSVVSWANVARFDGCYYAGVTGMVGFWLLLGDAATPLADWALFALAYLPLVLVEPVMTRAWLKLVRAAADGDGRLVRVTAIDRLALA